MYRFNCASPKLRSSKCLPGKYRVVHFIYSLLHGYIFEFLLHAMCKLLILAKKPNTLLLPPQLESVSWSLSWALWYIIFDWYELSYKQGLVHLFDGTGTNVFTILRTYRYAFWRIKTSKYTKIRLSENRKCISYFAFLLSMTMARLFPQITVFPASIHQAHQYSLNCCSSPSPLLLINVNQQDHR